MTAFQATKNHVENDVAEVVPQNINQSLLLMHI
jgi:hypothetical protein